MKRVGITQRVVTVESYDERRDALDQRWVSLLEPLGILPIPIPNGVANVGRFLEACPLDGLILSGGNSPHTHGGDAPERDRVEIQLIDIAIRQQMPTLAVCRGMQMLQLHYGGRLETVEGHVTKSLAITVNGEQRHVNSYHNLAFKETAPPLETWGFADDGVIKAIRHPDLPMVGIMWHP